SNRPPEMTQTSNRSSRRPSSAAISGSMGDFETASVSSRSNAMTRTSPATPKESRFNANSPDSTRADAAEYHGLRPGRTVSLVAVLGSTPPRQRSALRPAQCLQQAPCPQRAALSAAQRAVSAESTGSAASTAPPANWGMRSFGRRQGAEVAAAARSGATGRLGGRLRAGRLPDRVGQRFQVVGGGRRQGAL